jgi:hypothetical protein
LKDLTAIIDFETFHTKTNVSNRTYYYNVYYFLHKTDSGRDSRHNGIGEKRELEGVTQQSTTMGQSSGKCTLC